jgi:hypothetical protein
VTWIHGEKRRVPFAGRVRASELTDFHIIHERSCVSEKSTLINQVFEKRLKNALLALGMRLFACFGLI